jgi:hypothetical protein
MNFNLASIENLLPLLLMFGVLVAMLAGLQRKLEAIRSQTTDIYPPKMFLRSPGESTLNRIDRATSELLTFGIAVAVVPLILLLTYLAYVYIARRPQGGLEIAYLICLSVGFLLYGGNKLRRLSLKKKRLRKIYAGLQSVALEINTLLLAGHHVYHDFPSGRFYIDHIIVGPTGVFTLQSRIPSGFLRTPAPHDRRVRVVGNELITDKTTDTRTIPNTVLHASWLANWLLTDTGEAVRVQPLLTLPGWAVETIDDHAVIGVDPARIESVIRTTCVHPLSAESIHRLCTALETKYRRERAEKHRP